MSNRLRHIDYLAHIQKTQPVTRSACPTHRIGNPATGVAIPKKSRFLKTVFYQVFLPEPACGGAFKGFALTLLLQKSVKQNSG